MVREEGLECSQCVTGQIRTPCHLPSSPSTAWPPQAVVSGVRPVYARVDPPSRIAEQLVPPQPRSQLHRPSDPHLPLS